VFFNRPIFLAWDSSLSPALVNPTADDGGIDVSSPGLLGGGAGGGTGRGGTSLAHGLSARQKL
jgi:hypothetical protein